MPNILYPIIDGEITGGNLVCLQIIEEAIRRSYGVIVNSPSEGKFTQMLRGKRIRVYNIDIRHAFRLDGVIKLIKLIKSENIELIHTHTPLGGAVLSRIAGLLSGIPVVNHAHLGETFNKNILLKNIQFLLNWSTSRFSRVKVIAVSEEVKKAAIRQGVGRDKIAVIHNGIDMDDVTPKKDNAQLRRGLGIGSADKIIGEVGRLCESKGQHILIKAARRVLDKYPKTVFILVGEDLASAGRYKEQLEILACELGIKTHVMFTGYRSDISDLMNLFDIFALPSRLEGLSLVVMEAMRAKKPVIATPAGGNAELVVDKITGTIIPMNDPNALAEGIIFHLANEGESKLMGEKGYARLREYFSSAGMLNKIMYEYDEVLRS
ncbi:MAG: glycosyltransferase [Candidatus Omnitrophica bacterium]|nr:glycosyltransferase [Candidatus Omnitrophota bacterium]MDD5553091.1 glycosyltransferase [Candidatus Omnitrophota bacterium]